MLKQFVETGAPFKQWIHESKVVDTRPYIAHEEPTGPRYVTGIQFTPFGIRAMLNKPMKRRREVLGYLEVPYQVAGQEATVPAGNWMEVIARLPKGTVICADVYTESRHYVSTLRFTKTPDGTWAEEIEEEVVVEKVNKIA